MLEKLPLSSTTKANLMLKAFGMFKIPMIGFISARVTKLDDTTCEVFVPLNRKTRNHLKTMYFGAMAAGADTAAGLAAMLAMVELKSWVHLSFKDFKANFLKRADKDVIFKCTSVGAVKELVKRAIESKDRVEMAVPVEAFCNDELVATFSLTLSLKKK
ncbi:MAG: YiiD C-terminal domain-containing protein [Bdellovibrionales bacterium]|nr:YiiD C-terminal domain-containing protein [Bdellovibrionales bacterium]